MRCANIALLKQRCQRGRVKLSTLLVIALVIVGVCGLVAFRFRAHFAWMYGSSRLGLQDVRAIPDHPMPESPTPDGWVRCRVGCLEFSLPPELARNRLERGNTWFKHGSQTVVVNAPENVGLYSGLLEGAAAIAPPSQQVTTRPRFRLACYQASSDDFRWSMTPAEVRWHAFRITWAKMMRSVHDGHTESLLRDHLDLVVHYEFDDMAMLDWQSNEQNATGSMTFVDDEKIDPAWVRAVCQSIKVSKEAQE